MEKKSGLKKILSIRGMGGALTAFVGLIIIYVAFGIINPMVFSKNNKSTPIQSTQRKADLHRRLQLNRDNLK